MELYAQLTVLSKDTGTGIPKTPGHARPQVQQVLGGFLRGALWRERWSVLVEDSGRPCIQLDSDGEADFSVDFSLSHSKEALAVFAAAWGGGGLRIGCDVECVRPRKQYLEMAGDFFSRQELRWIAGGDGGEGLERFYRIWTAKEAWLKAQGKSVFDMAETPAFSPLRQNPCESLQATQFLVASPAATSYVVTAVSPFALPESALSLGEGWRLSRKEKMYAAERPVNTVSPKM